ncbi:polysaccharide biosynthesis tyrosine autokinase [Cellulosimicrobium terreum]|nr:polysaccharide biosynthesis tyrosine autokinase [Cellulosimicrobium terreum]
MELADYLSLLRKRWVSVAVLGIVGALLGGALSFVTTPTYSARSQVFVSVQGSDSTTDLLQGSNFTVRQVKSYTELVTSPRVLDPVVEELGLAEDASSLAARVRAESPLDTVLINVIATDESPRLAADLANATARSLAEVVGELETPAGAGESPVQISTVRSATVPESPSSPNTRLNVALGLVLGLVVGVVLAVLREVLDTRVRSRADVESVTGAAVLGVIGYEEDAPEHPLIVQESPKSPRAEAFRRLRTNLQFLEFDGGARTIVMTSSLPGEGKTTTSINLAITLADAGSRVVLVDADLRRPSVADYLGIEGSVGLTTVLIGRVGLEDATQRWGNGNLDVIAAGQVPPNPSELLGSTSMADLLTRLGAEYDVVVVDTPPLLPVTDAAVLATLAGGAILVVGTGTVHRAQLGDALDALRSVGARVLGTVVNRVPVRRDGRGSYGYSYYEYASEPAASARSGQSRVRHFSRHRKSDRTEAAPPPPPPPPPPPVTIPAHLDDDSLDDVEPDLPSGEFPFSQVSSPGAAGSPRDGR